MREEFLKRLVDMMETDAVLVCPGEELVFLTGFSPMLCERFQGLFVKHDGSMFYICNAIYTGEIGAAFGDSCPVFTWHDNEGMPKIAEILKAQGLWNKTVAVNSTAQGFNVIDLCAACGITAVNGKPLMEEIRIKKSREELQMMRKAAEIADSCYDRVCAMARPGIKESDIRDVILGTMESQGGYGFDCIVASGPNSSYPHYSSFDRVLQNGDPVVLDWGCHYKELMSDTSRTIFIGSVSDAQAAHYGLVNRAQLAGQAAAFEGAYIPDIDIAARTVLDEMGLASSLINRVGHGIGYSVHEGPYINQLNGRRLEKGMCFSVEPGVYFPGEYGIRIENIVCINENGETEILNKTDRSLRVVGK